MIWLIGTSLLDFGFAQLFKFGQTRGFHSHVVVSTNYLVLAAILSTYLFLEDGFVLSRPGLITGLVTGSVFVASLFAMTSALSRAPGSAVFTAFRISVAIPVAAGLILWEEPSAPIQLVGVVLTLVALVLMTSGMDASYHIRRWKLFFILVAVFLLQGISHSCLRSVHYNGLDQEHLGILVVVGWTAGVIGWISIFLRGRRPRIPELKLGTFIGIYNSLALTVFLIALSKMPGTLVFPVLGCSVVLLDNLTAHFFWKEHLNYVARVGVGVAVIAIFLVVSAA